jgi:hypothetical protein
MYKFKAEEQQQTESKFIAPGIHEVKITEITAVEPEGKSPYLNFKFENTKGQTTDDKLFMSEAALKYSTEAIDGIMGALGVDSEISGEDLTKVAKNLMKSIGNKKFRHRFTAEEVAGGEQKRNWFKAKMGRKYSNEAVGTEPSRLKPLDRTNQYDYKMLPVPSEVPVKPVASDDLPF